MTTVLHTIEEIRSLGYSDAMTAIRESGSTDTPDGDWDSWLINGIGSDATCRLFGEDPEDSADGWSDAMVAKLTAYCEGCREACAEVDAEST